MAERIIKCPHCNSDLTLDEQYLGMELQCPVCSQNFVAESGIELNSMIGNTEATADEENAVVESGANIKEKLGNLLSNAKQKLDEAQNEENKRFEESDQLKLFNKIRQGGIYRKIWQVIVPAVTGIIYLICFIAAGSMRGKDDALDFLGVVVCSVITGIVFAFSMGSFTSAKSQTNRKISEGDQASSEQIERKKLSGLFSGLTNWIQPVSNAMYQLWCDITTQDQQYLNELDILPRFGKNQDQLIAECHTLFSPVLQSFRLDENSNFLYPQENVTKLYTFEDQLIIFSAVWDYTTGNLFDESSSAFFFTEICDITTSAEYVDHTRTYYKLPENIKIKPFSLKNFLLIAAIIFVVVCLLTFPSVSRAFWDYGIINHAARAYTVAIAACFCISAFFISMICLIFDLNCLKKIIPQEVQKETKIKQSETFTITARSGKSAGITIVCNEWIEANNGKFTRRTDAEKIIQAIRKMIEEKKVAADA